MSRINRCLLLLSSLIVILSVIALLANFFVYRYPANNYFPDDTVRIACTLVLFYLGLILLVGKANKLSHIGRELICFFMVMSIVAFATNAVQLTPFHPIDDKIVAFEALFHVNIASILAWTHEHAHFDSLLRVIYDSLTYQMSVIPLFVLLMGRFQLLREYYFLLLFTTLIGFVFYYFYPTTAPASIINSPLFTSYQLDTNLKFHQIHNHIVPTTMEGGLIAMPSFHSIWALLCVYLLKEWAMPCFILLVINLLLIASCVLIGWHYPSDVIAGVVLVVFSYYLLKKITGRELKAFLAFEKSVVEVD